MTTSIQELIQRLEKGEDPAELLWSRLLAEEQELLQRCALVHGFDRDLVSVVLDPEGRVPFERLVRNPMVERVPRSEGRYRLREAERNHLLSAWSKREADFRALNAALASYFQGKGEGWELEGLYHSLVGGPPLETRIQAAFFWENANRSFDLARCQDLLAILDEREAVLEPELRTRREEWRRHLRTRSFWADEYTRTARFYERQHLRSRLEAMMDVEAQLRGGPHWILHLHAPGGMGKSMFLRWAIARWCVPSHIPCARIDFDVLDPVTSTRQPWLILLELARQLDVQLQGAPFQGFIGWLTDYVSSSRINFEGALETVEAGSSRAGHLGRLTGEEAQDRFISVLRETRHVGPVLLILDTVEEALLRPGADLERIVRLFMPMFRLYSQLRLILAGRYDLTERLPALARKLGPRMDVQRILPFTEDEARAYLSEKRGLGRDPRLEVVVEKSQGSPFKLALFADLLQSSPHLSREEIASWPEVDLLYLIERVVDRIDDRRVRWLLRYGVVPRRLTYPFLEEVMARHLLAAMSGASTLDEPVKDALPVERGEVFPTNLLRSPEETVDFRALWVELNRYASPFSWVYPAGEQTLVFHGDVLHPMRRLLQRQNVFYLLHRDAVAYFERRAEQEPERWAVFIREALYHRFQLEGALAGNYWRTVLERARASGHLGWVQEVADEVLGSDYLDEDRRPRLRDDGSPMLSQETLVLANYELARAGIGLARSASRQERERLLDQSRRYLDTVERLQARADGMSFVSKSRVQALRGVLAVRSSPEEAIRLLAEAKRSALSAEERLDAELHLADVLAESQRLEEALEHYRVILPLLSRVEPEERRALVEVQERFARVAARAGRFQEATEVLGDGRSMARESVWGEADQRMILQLVELGLQAGEPAKALQIFEANEGVEWASWDFQAQAMLLRGRAHLALRSPADAVGMGTELQRFVQGVRLSTRRMEASKRTEMVAMARELRADALVALLEPVEAIEELFAAEEEWRGLGEMDGVLRCRARSAHLQLVELDDERAVQQHFREVSRSDSGVQGEGWLALRLVEAELEDRLGRRGHAREIVNSLLAREPTWPPAVIVRILLQGLALKHVPRTMANDFTDELRRQLERIPTVAARLALLEPLRDISLERPLSKRWVDLVAPEGSEAAASQPYLDTLLQDSMRVEILRLCGLEEQAESLLRETGIGWMTAGRRFALREVLLAEDRLGWRAGAPFEILREIDPFLQEHGNYPTLCAALLLEQSERVGMITSGRGKRFLGMRSEILEPSWLWSEANKRLRHLRDVPPKWLLRLEPSLRTMSRPDDSLPPGENLESDSVPDEPRGGSERRNVFGIKLEVEEPWEGRHERRLLVRTGDELEDGPRAMDPEVPELREQLESRGRVFSYALLKRFVSDWCQMGEQLGAALLPRASVRALERASEVRDVRMEVEELGLAPVPWEFLVASGGARHLLSLSDWTHFFYRGPLAPSSHQAPPRSRPGPRKRDADAEMEVLLVGGNSTRDHLGLSLRELSMAYASNGFRPVVFEGGLDELDSLPAVLHIRADLEESPSVGGIFFNFGTSHLLTPSRLDRMLKRFHQPPHPVLVVLDVVSRPGETERATQLFLRNAFAAELFSLGSVAAVLGTGLEQFQDGLDSALIQALLEGASVGEMARRLRSTLLARFGREGRSPYDVLRGLTLLEVIGPLGTALFTDDPDWVPLPPRARKSAKKVSEMRRGS
ncbi:tetratricopeptide repeat protein [Archangium minus]|uniref:Tetratricopeptide repeat protein n=1 Tax=Archangium minus TaxID=83450 RepID=A0ABY9WNA8_9BACT|nr:tetratricopeptide repeat protein [Archangium minus]